MIRSFLPVGQGAFYCEQFGSIYGGEKINVIYDCGSSTGVDLVETQIRECFQKGETIHAVFLSHLDQDHINGLPYLLKYCRVEKIFFPLITKSDSLYIRLSNIIKSGKEDSFLNDFINNPYIAFDKLDLNHFPRLYKVSTNEDGHNNVDAVPIRSGENVGNIIFGDKWNEFNEWLFVPYNFRHTDRINELQDNFVKIFGKKMNNDELYRIWNEGGDSERKKVKEAYRKVTGSFNPNSMTLYSGVHNRRVTQEVYCGKCQHFLCNNMYNRKPSACLYTGDYDASKDKNWDALFDAYKDYWDSIGCVQIPHHGSRYSYNNRFADMDVFFVISAGTDNRYRHPHSMVIRDLLFHNHFPYIVTERKMSEIHFRVDVSGIIL